MLAEKLRSLFRPLAPPPLNGSGRNGHASYPPAHALHANGNDSNRPSNGLRQFFDNVRGARLQILDLGGACQANVNFITSQGHKIYSEDLLVCVERLAAQAKDTPARAAICQGFVQDSLNFPDRHFDGILVWDSLEFLDEEILAAVMSRLQAIVKPGGTMLAFFHTQAKGQSVPIYRYQIQKTDSLRLQLRFVRPLPRAFNNRNLERLFQQFKSVKFFLAKDGLREVIITK